MSAGSWKIWMDTGGTFTDCLAIPPDGTFRRLKIPSNSSLKGTIVGKISGTEYQVQLHWNVSRDIFGDFTIRILGKKVITRKVAKVDIAQSILTLDQPISSKIQGASVELTTHEEVPVLAARLLTETALNKTFPPIELKLGSTRGTNAILERKGARTALLITKGFKDLLLIGNQQRPDLFAIHIQREKPLYEVVEEVEERIERNGSVLQQINRTQLRKTLQKLKRKKIESIAIAFVNSYKNPQHEMVAEALAKEEGFQYISTSHQLSRQIKIVPRVETTVANAYLAPIIFNYVQRIQSSLNHATIKMMTSAGGLIHAQSFFPKDSLLSGPAGGVVGAATSAQLSGHDQLITFDMGGTSTDVSLYHQRYDYRYESHVGNIKILSPSLAIETIAAGGGSICSFDGYKFTVGPHSAGAKPGPACYGAGGPLTITDVNLLLGKINPQKFAVPLHRAQAEKALQEVIRMAQKKLKRKLRAEDVLQGFVDIANEKMSEAIRKVSVQQGYDPTEFTLLSFGGAGGQHACQLARMLNMRRILIPYDAGLLSAYGIGHARVERFAERLILQNIHEVNDLESHFDALWKDAKKQLEEEGYQDKEIMQDKRLAFLRFSGQESALEILFESEDQLLTHFRKKYEAIFGHWLEDRAIELESIRLIASAAGYTTQAKSKVADAYTPQPSASQLYINRGRKGKIDLYQWEELLPGATIEGPAIVSSHNSTTVVESGWIFSLDENNHAVLNQTKATEAAHNHDQAASLELFSNRFTAIAQEMGALLQRTSFSVNVKERLDFSCAVLDHEGFLIVNAPHIPVHLGSMGVCVREVGKVLPMKEGDVIITNHPAFGGSHLPDVTLIKPVFFKKQLIGYVANRAHHAEIGGKKPGSMPADATRLVEEGVIISPTLLVKEGKPQWDVVRKIFTTAQYPTRLLEENLADLNGALASVNLGEQLLQELCLRYSTSQVTRHMLLLKEYAAQLLLQTTKSLSRKLKAIEYLDDGAPLCVSISRTGKKLIIDFSGSSSQHTGNLNATKAIVQSVVLYSLRLWVNQPIAMNEGLLKNVQLLLPKGLLNPDFNGTENDLPAVVGGNTEISQRLTDTFLKALKLVACSQGTMNNFLFGNDRFGYYETIGGGSGAGKGFDGESGVHTHMTNTRITDPEILEHRYPVRLIRFEIQKGSGGKGKWKGGDGLIREVMFKEPVEVNMLTQHRQQKPYGLGGGAPGKTGEQYVLQQGKHIKLKGIDSVSLHAGDSVVIKTPGGGGFGRQ